MDKQSAQKYLAVFPIGSRVQHWSGKTGTVVGHSIKRYADHWELQDGAENGYIPAIIVQADLVGRQRKHHAPTQWDGIVPLDYYGPWSFSSSDLSFLFGAQGRLHDYQIPNHSSLNR